MVPEPATDEATGPGTVHVTTAFHKGSACTDSASSTRRTDGLPSVLGS